MARAPRASIPNDRKAQEALKKKYLTLGRWDDLEVFYAESGKWDEFIRVLEQQEAKEANAEAKIGLLFKIAELWADKKQKNDRAARAYEKVLELEPQNLRAAEALIPIYSQAGNAKALANAIEVKLGHEEDAYAKLALLREVAGSLRGQGQGAAEGVRALPVGVRALPRGRADHRRRRARRQGAPASGTQVEAAYTQGDRRGRRARATRRSRSRCVSSSVASSSRR